MRIENLKEKILSRTLPKHIGIILDGNGRWATRRMLPRTLGHEKGIQTLKEITLEVKKLGIPNLTVFAFSTENWNRPKEEVDYLLNQLKKFYQEGLKKVIKEKIRIKVIGTKENLPSDLVMMIEDLEYQTKIFTEFTLTIAFNYGSKQEIIEACKKIAWEAINKEISVHNIDDAYFTKHLYTADLYPLDFIIRTSGEERLSNFLLYQAAYAELYFPKTLWPDFHKKELYIAINTYQNRNRRFGGLDKK